MSLTSSTAKGYQKIKYCHLSSMDIYQRADFQHEDPLWYRSAFLNSFVTTAWCSCQGLHWLISLSGTGGHRDTHFFAYSKWKILSFSTIKIICLPGVDFSKSQNNKFSMGREGTTLLHLPSVVLMPLCEERAPLTSYRIWEHDTDVLSSALVFTCKLSPVTQHSNSSFFKALVNLQAPGTCRSM